MSYKVTISTTHRFLSNAKRLAKKYASLKSDLLNLQEELLLNPKLGVLIKENIYKIRLTIKSKNRGKSGGARVITYYFEETQDQLKVEVFLLTIYDKSNSDSIEDSELADLIEEVQQMLEDRDKVEDEE